MLTPEEASELRSLQVRAYAPGGGLAAADAARLHELEARRVAESAPAGAPASPPGLRAHARLDRGASRDAADPVDGDDADDLAELLGGVESTPGHVVSAEDASSLPLDPSAARAPRGIRTLLRRRWVPYAASALALLLGFGVGWLVFARGVEQIALTTGNAAKQAELNADEQFDAGSVVPVGEKDGATVWRATSDEGESECLIVTHGDLDGRACVPREDFELNGVQAYIAVPREDEEITDQISAGVVYGLDDRPVVVVQSWMSYHSGDWRSMYTDEELVFADRLVAEGYDGAMLQILGYDGETPIWMAWTESGACLVVAGPDRTDEACSPDQMASVRLEVPAGDGTTTYVMTSSEYRGPMLTIERNSPASLDDRTGESEAD